MFNTLFYDEETECAAYWIPVGSEPEGQIQCVCEETDSGDESDDTISSNEAREFFQEINGRQFVNNSNVPKWFPTDNLQRPRIVHQLLKLIHGGNTFGPISDVLSPDGDNRPRVLDLFTRDGSWVQEMAQEFPHVDFVSLDVAPMARHRPRRNIVFEVYDLQHHILELDESFDMICMQQAAETLKDIPSFLKEIQRVLKPGGLLYTIEPEFALYDDQDTDHFSLRKTPLTWKALEAVGAALRHQGVELDAYQLMPTWLSPNSSLWANHDPLLFLPFERIETGYDVIFAGGWDADVKQQEIRLLLAQLGTFIWRDMGSVLTMSGTPEKDTLEFVSGATSEMQDLGTQYAFKFHHTTAYKSLVRCHS